MHPIDLDDGELALMKEARKDGDWTILPTWKLRYLYQRFVALPGGDIGSVKKIAGGADGLHGNWGSMELPLEKREEL